MATIKDRVRVVLEGNPVLSSIILNEWPLHGWTHEAGGIDQISVNSLSGLLADPQNAGWLRGYPIDLSTIAPISGQVLVFNGTSWVPGTGEGVSSLNSLQGDLVINYADGILITDDSSSEITIANTGVLSLSSDDNDEQMAGHLKITSGANIVVDALDAGDGIQISAIIADVLYHPYDFTVNTGTLNDGVVGDLEDFNSGNYLDIQEVSGAPGFDIRFQFRSVVGINKISFYLKYLGVGSHSVHVEIYNYDTASWTELGEFTLGATWQLLEYPLPADTDYIDGSGNSELRLNHDDSGIPSHSIWVDYVALVRAATGTGGVTDHGALTGLTDTSDHPWAFLVDGTRTATGSFDMGNHDVIDGPSLVTCYNNTFVSSYPGMLFYAAGNNGGLINVGLATNPNVVTKAFGVAVEVAAQGSPVKAAILGHLVDVIDTSAWVINTALWEGLSGAITATQPAAPNDSVYIGEVTKQGTPGSVFIRPHTVPRLSFLSDVNDRATTGSLGSMLAWNSTSNYWDRTSDLILDSIIINSNGYIVVPDTTGEIRFGDANTSIQRVAAEQGLIIKSDIAVAFNDGYINGAFGWTFENFAIAANTGEYSALTAAYGSGDHSIAWYLEAARTASGVTLDGAYDYDSPGAGALIIADSGPVQIRNSGENAVLRISQNSATPVTTDAVVRINNNDLDAGNASIELYGSAGTNNLHGLGNQIKTADGALSLVSTLPTVAANEQSFLKLGSDEYDVAEHATAILRAEYPISSPTVYAYLSVDAWAGDFYGYATGEASLGAVGDVELNAGDDVNIIAGDNIDLDAADYVSISVDQGSPAEPSFFLGTNVATTPFVTRVVDDTDFYLYQGKPTAGTPFYSELLMQYTDGDPDTQSALFGSYAGAAGATGYARLSTATKTTGDSNLYLISVKSGEASVFIHQELTASVNEITLNAETILYNGLIGQEQSVTLTSSSTTLAVNLTSGNHQNWSIGHTLAAINFTAPSTWGVNYHIHITFSGSFTINSSAWPSSVDWVDGTDGELVGASGETYVLSIQKHGTDYIASYTAEAV